MDPSACIQRILDAFNDGNHDELLDAMSDLFNWLKNGGFSPMIPAKFPASIMASESQTVYLELRQVENSSEFEFVRCLLYLADQDGISKRYRQSHRFLLT